MQRLRILAGVPRTISALVVLAIIVAGAFLAYGTREIVSFQTVAWGAYASGYSEASNLVINDAATWAQVWTQAFCSSPNPCLPTPVVNFSSTTILAVFSGVKPSSGYRTNVTRVSGMGGGILVDVSSTAPGHNCYEAQIVTYPFHIVSIPKTDAHAAFASRTSLRNC